MTTLTANQSTARARQACQLHTDVRSLPFYFACLSLSATLFSSLFVGAAFAQVSPEEHAQHHPGQAQSAGAENGPASAGGSGTKGGGGGMMGGGKDGGMMGGGGGMMGGGKGGGMGGMMDKMGAPKPREMYPRLMGLPDLPMEERAQIEAEAHQRMIEGTELMTNGFAQLAEAAPGEDFAAMQSATAAVREGLAQFESGLAAHRAIAEGKAPRNVALQWFKGEMNLLPPGPASSGFRFFGMTVFHSAIMAVLVIFAVAMIWMYFFKMRRASALLETLSNSDGKSAPNFTQVPKAAAVTPPVQKTMPTTAPPPQAASSSGGTAADAAGDCCADGEETCPTESTEGVEISEGLLPVAKKKLCRLRVARITQETADVKTFRLVACHGSGLPFSYLPGQFLTLTLPVAEKPIRRSYTISSSPTQGYFCEVTIKREEQGAGSRYLHDNVKVGDTLEVKAPSGKFTFTGEESDSIVLISGGVGITPMMSVVRALSDMCWLGDIYFIVACRDSEHFIFEEELKLLQQRYENLHVHAAMSRMDKDIGNYRFGRLSKEMLTEWVPGISSQRIHICGAPPMMDSTKKMLTELGVPSENVHSENFGSTKKPKAKSKTEPKIEPASATAGKPEASTVAPAGAAVTFATSNKTANLEPEETILEASERIGVDIDYSCRVGTCGECVVKLLSGNVTMETDDGLDPDDKAAGMILACQAIAEQDVSVEA